MIAEMLRSVTAAVILGCAALYLTRDGPIREILRIAAGVMILTAAVQPFLQADSAAEEYMLPAYADISCLAAEQNAVYETGLADESERVIAAYFAERGWEVTPEVAFEDGDISRVILCFAQAYNWTKDDRDAFTAWSGIASEKQEWVWSTSTGNKSADAAVS